MNVVLIGLGSIGRKHIQALRAIEPDARISAFRSSRSSGYDDGVANIYSWEEVPADIDLFVVSNPTSMHLETLQELVAFGKPVFIEKPALMSLDGADELIETYKAKNILTYTACNLRFHPVIHWAKENLKDLNIYEVSAYSGSYLPDWRKNIDYRKNYSAIAAQGGGVHLDLIHEIDYLTYLFGTPERSQHHLSKVSNLEIDSIDSALYWLFYPKFTASVMLNYFRRQPKRAFEVVTDNDVLTLDIMNAKVTNDAGEVLFADNGGVLKTYEYQMQYFIDAIRQGYKPMNSLEEAINTLRTALGQW
jgi:predicted dehydrogenase